AHRRVAAATVAPARRGPAGRPGQERPPRRRAARAAARRARARRRRPSQEAVVPDGARDVAPRAPRLSRPLPDECAARCTASARGGVVRGGQEFPSCPPNPDPPGVAMPRSFAALLALLSPAALATTGCYYDYWDHKNFNNGTAGQLRLVPANDFVLPPSDAN